MTKVPRPIPPVSRHEGPGLESIEDLGSLAVAGARWIAAFVVFLPGVGGMDSFRRPGGFASPLSPTRRHLSAENCTDASCGCSVDASGTAVGAWARSRQPAPRRDASLEVETRRVQPWRAKFEWRSYVQLVAVDQEARRVALFFFSQLVVLALELLLPAVWRMDPTLLGAALRGLLRSISLALVLHAMAMTTRLPTTAYSYGCAIFAGRSSS